MKYQGRQVYFIRPIDKKNFNPMCHKLIDDGLILQNCVQIYVDVIGGQGWINVERKELK
jgi:hypothetical protein